MPDRASRIGEPPPVRSTKMAMFASTNTIDSWSWMCGKVKRVEVNASAYFRNFRKVSLDLPQSHVL